MSRRHDPLAHIPRRAFIAEDDRLVRMAGASRDVTVERRVDRVLAALVDLGDTSARRPVSTKWASP